MSVVLFYSVPVISGSMKIKEDLFEVTHTCTRGGPRHFEKDWKVASLILLGHYLPFFVNFKHENDKIYNKKWCQPPAPSPECATAYHKIFLSLCKGWYSKLFKILITLKLDGITVRIDKMKLWDLMFLLIRFSYTMMCTNCHRLYLHFIFCIIKNGCLEIYSYLCTEYIHMWRIWISIYSSESSIM